MKRIIPQFLIRFSQSLRGPLLALLLVMLVLTAALLGLIFQLGIRTLDAQYVLARESVEERATLEMEINLREHESALFYYLRDGEPLHLDRLADVRPTFTPRWPHTWPPPRRNPKT